MDAEAGWRRGAAARRREACEVEKQSAYLNIKKKSNQLGMLAVGVLVACILWEAGADGGNGNIIRVGVVLGVNNGTAAAGFGRALTSDQEQWCAEQGVQVITTSRLYFAHDAVEA